MWGGVCGDVWGGVWGGVEKLAKPLQQSYNRLPLNMYV